MRTGKKNAKPALSPEAENKQLYVAMVKAVRARIAVEYPRPLDDRVDITLYNNVGGGESLAWFHASESCPYVLGDMMAVDVNPE